MSKKNLNYTFLSADESAKYIYVCFVCMYIKNRTWQTLDSREYE